MNDKIIVLTPAYEDSESLKILADVLYRQFKENLYLIVMDDCSSKKIMKDAVFPVGLDGVVVNLKHNVGSQAAIAVGLKYIKFISDKRDLEYQKIVVMDSDGEDRPESINELLSNLVKTVSKAQHSNQCVVSFRKSRKNDIFFNFFYSIYKVVFYILTGRLMNFGNFMVINKIGSDAIVNTKTSQIHLAPSLMFSGVSYSTVPQDRGKRYRGKSKMNFSSLTNHALNSFLVCKDRICTRLFVLWLLVGLGLSFDVSQMTYPTILLILFGIFLQFKFVTTVTLANRKIKNLVSFNIN